MANSLLAMIGATFLLVLFAGAIIALVVMSAQAFIALFRAIGILK